MRTIIWQYDSNDWRAGTGNITQATVDGNYQSLINMASSGTFNNVRHADFVYPISGIAQKTHPIKKRGAIMLMHELNNFTMSVAVKFYPKLKAAFKVGSVWYLEYPWP